MYDSMKISNLIQCKSISKYACGGSTLTLVFVTSVGNSYILTCISGFCISKTNRNFNTVRNAIFDTKYILSIYNYLAHIGF